MPPFTFVYVGSKGRPYRTVIVEGYEVLVGKGSEENDHLTFDVAEPTLRATADAIAEEYPGIDVHAVVGDFRRHLDALPTEGRRMIAFLGGTIGNLRPHERAALLQELASSMRPGDSLLLGTDLVKDRGRLVAAYDDAAGITAAFNRNILLHVNRVLGTAFAPVAFTHVALYDDATGRVEMHLEARAAHVVEIDGIERRFEAGERVHTENSWKYAPAGFTAMLQRAGFGEVRCWQDPAGDFAVYYAG